MWTLGVSIAVLALAGVLTVNVRLDAQRERATAQLVAAEALAAADQASFENARDERIRCEQSVETRELVRGVLIGVAVRLGASDDDIETIVKFLDAEYPSKSLDDCPPIPTPPGG